MPSTPLSDALSQMAQALPAATRKKVYKVAKFVAGLLTLVLLALPLLPSLGVNWSEAGVVATVATAILAAISHLADSNTHPTP